MHGHTCLALKVSAYLQVLLNPTVLSATCVPIEPSSTCGQKAAQEICLVISTRTSCGPWRTAMSRLAHLCCASLRTLLRLSAVELCRCTLRRAGRSTARPPSAASRRRATTRRAWPHRASARSACLSAKIKRRLVQTAGCGVNTGCHAVKCQRTARAMCQPCPLRCADARRVTVPQLHPEEPARQPRLR